MLLGSTPLVAQAGDSAALRGRVDGAMIQQAIMAIHEHRAVVNLASEWRGPDGQLESGGNSEAGWAIGDMFRLAKIKVRCSGLCFSSAAHILIASRGCIVGPHGRIILHVPVPGAISGISANNIGLRDILADKWRARMIAYDVPSDIVDRALSARSGMNELRTYEMSRIGCAVE
jgi:hypothetical protein